MELEAEVHTVKESIARVEERLKSLTDKIDTFISHHGTEEQRCLRTEQAVLELEKQIIKMTSDNRLLRLGVGIALLGGLGGGSSVLLKFLGG